MRIISTLLIALLAQSIHAAEFRAGAFAADITPTKWPVYLVGSFSERGANKAWDKLHARAIVLNDGKTSLAIVVIDSCYVPRTLLDNAKKQIEKKTGIPVKNQLMAATHTHSAPPSKKSWAAGAGPGDPYIERLTQGIVKSVVQAHAQLQPAKIGWGTTKVPEEVHNRRWFVKPNGIRPNPFGEETDQVRMNPPRGSALLIRPAGPIDPEIVFISVQTTKGEPIALLANYSLHYVGGVPSGGVSADYFGEFARMVESQLTPKDSKLTYPVVGIMSNGTSGDINNINFRKAGPRKKPFEQIKLVAKRCADGVMKAMKEMKYQDSLTLDAAQKDITVAVRKPTPLQKERAKQHLKEKDEKKLPIRAKAYARRALELDKGPKTVEVLLQALRIGDLGIAAIPCEVFVEIGLEIKRKGPFKKTFTMELANDHFGYLPTPRQHRLGGYETWLGTNMLEVNASEKITKTILELFATVKD